MISERGRNERKHRGQETKAQGRYGRAVEVEVGANAVSVVDWTGGG